MALQKRTWEYGTELSGIVMVADPKLIVVHVPDINEGFLLAEHGVKDLPKGGDLCTITFTKGGPTGGYWKWQPLNPSTNG